MLEHVADILKRKIIGDTDVWTDPRRSTFMALGLQHQARNVADKAWRKNKVLGRPEPEPAGERLAGKRARLLRNLSAWRIDHGLSALDDAGQSSAPPHGGDGTANASSQQAACSLQAATMHLQAAALFSHAAAMQLQGQQLPPTSSPSLQHTGHILNEGNGYATLTNFFDRHPSLVQDLLSKKATKGEAISGGTVQIPAQGQIATRIQECAQSCKPIATAVKV